MFHAGPGLIGIEATAHNDKSGSAVNVIVTDLDNNKKFASIHFGHTNQPKTLKTQFVYGRQSKMLLRLETDDSTVEYRVILSGAVKLPRGQEISRLPVVSTNLDREYLVSTASTDLNNPSSLPSKHLYGYGIRERITYYFKFFANAGNIDIAATAHNDKSGSALNVIVSDLDNNKKFASIHFGFSGSPKTLRENFTYGSQGPLLLQLTLDDSTVEYRVRLSGSVKLPP